MPDPSKTLREGAIAPWTTPAYQGMQQELLERAAQLGIPTDVPFRRLTREQVATVVEGSPEHGFTGLRGFFRWLETKSYKMHVRGLPEPLAGLQALPRLPRGPAPARGAGGQGRRAGHRGALGPEDRRRAGLLDGSRTDASSKPGGAAGPRTGR